MAHTHSLDLESTSSQYAQRADTASLSITGDMTIEGWIKLESAPATDNLFGIVAKLLPTGNQRSYALTRFNDAGTLKIRMNINQDGAALSDTIDWTPTLNTGTWYHIAIVIDVSEAAATEMLLYLDTVSQGNGTVAADNGVTSIFDSTADFEIGAQNDTSFFDGLLHDVRVWSDIRTATEISDNWQTSTPAGNNLQGQWYVNDDHNDDSANANNLTASGAPVFSTDLPYTDIVGIPFDLTSKYW